MEKITTMEGQDFASFSNEELLIEKKKLKKSKIIHAVLIGFLAGVFGFGMVGWIMNPERKLGFLIPMLIPVVFIYRMLKNGKQNQELEKVLNERGLN